MTSEDGETHEIRTCRCYFGRRPVTRVFTKPLDFDFAAGWLAGWAIQGFRATLWRYKPGNASLWVALKMIEKSRLRLLPFTGGTILEQASGHLLSSEAVQGRRRGFMKVAMNSNQPALRSVNLPLSSYDSLNLLLRHLRNGDDSLGDLSRDDCMTNATERAGISKQWMVPFP